MSKTFNIFPGKGHCFKEMNLPLFKWKNMFQNIEMRESIKETQ